MRFTLVLALCCRWYTSIFSDHSPAGRSALSSPIGPAVSCSRFCAVLQIVYTSVLIPLPRWEIGSFVPLWADSVVFSSFRAVLQIVHTSVLTPLPRWEIGCVVPLWAVSVVYSCFRLCRSVYTDQCSHTTPPLGDGLVRPPLGRKTGDMNPLLLDCCWYGFLCRPRLTHK